MNNMNNILGTMADAYEADAFNVLTHYRGIAAAGSKPQWYSDDATTLGKTLSGSIIEMKDGTFTYVPVNSPAKTTPTGPAIRIIPAGEDHGHFRDFGWNCTDDVADIGREYARAAGWSEAAVAAVGGKCWRIGGATDLRALCQSAAEAERVLKRRGRWSSDIGEIYARTTIEEGAAYSAAIGDAAGTDLERLGSGAGWAEPAAHF